MLACRALRDLVWRNFVIFPVSMPSWDPLAGCASEQHPHAGSMLFSRDRLDIVRNAPEIAQIDWARARAIVLSSQRRV